MALAMSLNPTLTPEKIRSISEKALESGGVRASDLKVIKHCPLKEMTAALGDNYGPLLFTWAFQALVGAYLPGTYPTIEGMDHVEGDTPDEKALAFVAYVEESEELDEIPDLPSGLG